MHIAQLLFITSIEDSRKFVCQAPGCGRAIARSVHVIRDQGGSVRVIGSGCFGKLSGHDTATKQGPAFGGFDGQRLTPEERALMVADTVAFVARIEAKLEADREADRQAERAKHASADGLRNPHLFSPLGSHRDRSANDFAHMPNRIAIAPGCRGILDQANKLSQYRIERARDAAKLALQHRPALGAYSFDEVVGAMVQAKATYLARGLNLETPGSLGVIEALAEAALKGKGPPKLAK